MFRDGCPLTDVAIELDIETPTILSYYEDYIRLVNTRYLVVVYNEVKHDLTLFLGLYRRIKKEGLGKQQIVKLLKTPNRLLNLKDRANLFNDHL